MPIKRLKALIPEIDTIIKGRENIATRSDEEIAIEHDGQPHLIHSVTRIIGDKASGRWQQIEMIFCCAEHCPRCPHGEFRYRYRTNKTKGTTTVDFIGEPGLPSAILESMRDDIRQPQAYAVKIEKV